MSSFFISVNKFIHHLQAQLTRSMAAEEANLAEIQRLASAVAELQAELAFRPTREEHERLAALAASATATVPAPAPDKADKATDAARTPDRDDRDLSREIDDLFRLDDDDDDTDSATTELEANADKLDDEERLRVTLQNGALHALEEELVRAKEGWAAAESERGRLAARLAERGGAGGLRTAALLALAAALLAWLLLPLLP